MSSKNINLRAALSKVLERPHSDLKSDKYDTVCDTPWYLQCSGVNQLLQDTYQLPQDTYSAWLERGREEIKDIKTQRLGDYVAPEDPFLSIGLKLYGDAFDPTKEAKGCSLM